MIHPSYDDVKFALEVATISANRKVLKSLLLECPSYIFHAVSWSHLHNGDVFDIDAICSRQMYDPKIKQIHAVLSRKGSEKMYSFPEGIILKVK